MPSSAPIRPDPTHARYETLLEVAESIAAHRQLSTLFADLSRCLNSLVSFDFISLTLLDSKGHFVRMHLLQTDREVVGTPPRDADPDRADSHRRGHPHAAAAVHRRRRRPTSGFP